jgi:hypothetical protein
MSEVGIGIGLLGIIVSVVCVIIIIIVIIVMSGKKEEKEKVIDGGWSDWVKSGECDKECGPGKQKYIKTCSEPKPSGGGKVCVGESSKFQDCKIKECKIDGGWSDWVKSGDCDKDCGPGKQKHTRMCINPPPQNGGSNCDRIDGGTDEKYTDCKNKECPVDGGWSEWVDVKECDKICGDGIINQRRYCTNPSPAHGGKECQGTSYNDKKCKLKECPVHGGWSGWTVVSACDKECGTGLMKKERNCNNPSPQHGGNNCSGNNTETVACNTQPCQIDKARYIKYFNTNKDCQNLLQISVFTKDGKNVALGKPVTESSIYSTSHSGRNLTDNNLDTMSHTVCDSTDNWWTIDLQEEYLVDKIIVSNRRDCCQNRAIGSKLSLLNKNKQVVFTSNAFQGESNYYAFLPSKGAEIYECSTQFCPINSPINETLQLKTDPGTTLFNGRLVNALNNTGGKYAYLDSGGTAVGDVKVWKEPHINTHWELTSDRHMKSNVADICISAKNDLLTRENCVNTPDQLWSYSDWQFKNDNGYYIKRSTSSQSGAIGSSRTAGSGWSIKHVEHPRKTYSLGDLTVKDFFNDTIVNLGEKFNDWNPTFNQGIPAMDANGKMVFLSLIYNYGNIPWTLTWFENKTKQVLDLRSFFSTRVEELNAYHNFEGAAKIVFNISNEAFMLINLNRLVKFDYKNKKFIETIATDNMGIIENKFHTNNPFYNNYPILTNIRKPNMSVSRYENGKYTTFTAPDFSKTDLDAKSYFSTIQHSGRNSATFSVHNITFICFASNHDPLSIAGRGGSPQWITAFNHNNNSWSTPVLLGYGGRNNDGHNAPSITITSRGIIYVFFGNHHDLSYYVKSSKPYDINSFGSPIQLPGVSGQTSTRMFTYPACNIDTKDNIYVTYRGPWYAFSIWKIDTKTGKTTSKRIFDVEKPIRIDGSQKGTGVITATNYAAWRDVMTIDQNDNLYIYIYPKAHTEGWDKQPHSLTGPFVLVSVDGANSFKIME